MFSSHVWSEIAKELCVAFQNTPDSCAFVYLVKGTETKRGVFLAIGPLLHLESDHAVRQRHYAFFEKVASISQDYRRNGGQRLYHREAYHH